MARLGLWDQHRFRPEDDFVALRPISLSTGNLKRGDPVDKTKLTPRLLRILFERRHIAVASKGPTGATAAPPRPPPPAIPPAWRDLDWNDLRALARAINGGQLVKNKADAVSVIELELARRAARNP